TKTASRIRELTQTGETNGSVTVENIVAAGKRAFFSRTTRGTVELWSTNGTSTGTVKVIDLLKDDRKSNGRFGGPRVIPQGGVNYFAWNNSKGSLDLWRSD